MATLASKVTITAKGFHLAQALSALHTAAFSLCIKAGGGGGGGGGGITRQGTVTLAGNRCLGGTGITH